MRCDGQESDCSWPMRLTCLDEFRRGDICFPERCAFVVRRSFKKIEKNRVDEESEESHELDIRTRSVQSECFCVTGAIKILIGRKNADFIFAGKTALGKSIAGGSE